MDKLGIIYQDSYGGVDSNLWLELFKNAGMISEDLARRLQYLRNTGCRLQKNDKWGYVIVPVVGDNGWYPHCNDPKSNCNKCENKCYESERQCLNRYRNEVIGLLKNLENVKQGTLFWSGN